jgi:hypothetical protein
VKFVGSVELNRESGARGSPRFVDGTVFIRLVCGCKPSGISERKLAKRKYL